MRIKSSNLRTQSFDPEDEVPLPAGAPLPPPLAARRQPPLRPPGMRDPDQLGALGVDTAPMLRRLQLHVEDTVPSSRSATNAMRSDGDLG